MENKGCPFCGSKVKITRGVFNAPFLFFKCVNEECGAVISFDNEKANLLPEMAMRNFNRRYADESKS